MLLLRQYVLEMPEDVNGSIAGKMITRILYFDYITTAITPLPKQ